MALFFWNWAASSVLPMRMRIDEAPPNSASPPERLSAFHAEIKCDRRSWKRFLSILISAMVEAGCGDGRDVRLKKQK